MPTVAIYSSDVTLRRRLDRLLRTDQPFRVAGSAGDAAAFGLLLEQQAVDVAVADAPHDVLSDWCRRFDKTAFVAMTVEADAEELDRSPLGPMRFLIARRAMPRSWLRSSPQQHGLALLPRPLLGALLASRRHRSARDRDRNQTDDPSPLTPRELEVLVAMADGISNKTIARRLGISYHTVKFPRRDPGQARRRQPNRGGCARRASGAGDAVR